MSTPIVPQRTDEVVLFQDEDQREIDRLARALEAAAAMSESPLRLGDDPAVVAAADACDMFTADAADRGVTVVLKAMPGRKWRSLVAEHPPRRDHEADAEWGFNHLTMADAAVPPCVVSIGGRELVGTDLEAELDRMNDGDFSKVYAHVLRLNTGQGPNPKDSISRLLPRSSDETSESHERLV